MDKKTIALLLVVSSSFVSSASANSIINKFIPNQSPAIPSIIKAHKMTKQTNRSYTNFSGTWMGNCGNGSSISTVIENDAEYISLDGNESIIGRGLQGIYESNDDISGYEHTSWEWNADGSALVMKSARVSKDSTDSSAMQTDISTFTLTMQKGQINLDGKRIMFEDATQSRQPFIAHCVFTKKQ